MVFEIIITILFWSKRLVPKAGIEILPPERLILKTVMKDGVY